MILLLSHIDPKMEKGNGSNETVYSYEGERVSATPPQEEEKAQENLPVDITPITTPQDDPQRQLLWEEIRHEVRRTAEKIQLKRGLSPEETLQVAREIQAKRESSIDPANLNPENLKPGKRKATEPLDHPCPKQNPKGSYRPHPREFRQTPTSPSSQMMLNPQIYPRKTLS